MDPNQNSQPQPQPMQPQPAMPVDTPAPQQMQSTSGYPDPAMQAQTPQPQPMMQQPPTDAQPAPQSMPVTDQPQQAAATPVMQQQPIQQSVPPASAFPQPPAPMPMQPAAPNPAFQGPAAAVPVKKPFPVKLVAALGGGFLALAALIVGGWFAYTAFFGAIPLKEYQADDYSILVPKDYEQKDDSFGDGIVFQKPDTTAEDRSRVSVSSIELNDTFLKRDKMIETLDKALNEDKLKEDYEDEGSLTNLKIDRNAKVGSVEARRITATANKEGKKVGSIDIAYIFGEKKLYLVSVGAHVSEPGLAQSSDKIINSFKIK